MYGFDNHIHPMIDRQGTEQQHYKGFAVNLVCLWKHSNLQS